VVNRANFLSFQTLSGLSFSPSTDHIENIQTSSCHRQLHLFLEFLETLKLSIQIFRILSHCSPRFKVNFRDMLLLNELGQNAKQAPSVALAI
jgi:hypothetical protein